MPLVKQELEEQNQNCDDWLLQWSNPKNEVEEDKKPIMSSLQSDIKTEKDEETWKGKSKKKFNNSNSSLKKGEKLKRKKNYGIERPDVIGKTKNNMLGDIKMESINELEEESASSVPTRQNIKNTQQDVFDKNIKGRKCTLEESIKQAPVSQNVDNLCEYQCPKCAKIFLTRRYMYKHFRESSHVTITAKNTSAQYLLKIVAHRCSVCLKKILCNKQEISNHIFNRHKIRSLKQYAEEMNIEYNSRKKLSSVEYAQFIKACSSQQNTTNQLGNLCKYACSKCNFSCINWRLMTKHLSSKSCKQVASLSQLITKITFHKCQICGELVLCDNRFIGNHLVKHKINIEQYIVQIKMLPKESECLKEAYLQKLKLMIQDIPVTQKLASNVLESNCLPDDQVTRNVGNINFFQCPICLQTKFSYNNLAWHKKAKHGMVKAHYKNAQPVEARYHKCHICDKILLCDNGIIGTHVLKRHKINFSQYVAENVLKNGYKAIPTFRDYKKSIEKAFNAAEPTKEDSNYDSGLIDPSMISSESEDSDD